ncbi:MAG: VanR-ABDEGLN family response regulator transcription factor [Anaerococcus vaginalis]|nr:VanR-ABDEGLN family response regulator transcription factor [Anaerococcus vaginalis]
MNDKIIIVDDEKEIADLLELCLTNDGFSVSKAFNAKDALDLVEAENFDLMILDIMLEDMDGFSVCKKIREKHYFPIIMLTSRIDSNDKILGLTMGADDYITKPFNPLEVIARVKTQLRRSQKYNKTENIKDDEAYDIRGLLIDKKSHKCFLYDKQIQLTPIEFEIIWYLCKNQGKVVSSEELFENIWKEKYLDNNNTVMAHIGRIRDKMNDSGRNPKFIKTVWGVGYEIE